jgi:DNA polymerase III alpha subunit
MFYTELTNRKLHFDGISSYDPNNILQLHSTAINWVDYITPKIDQYNKLVNSSKKIQVKPDNSVWDISWNLPKKYEELDVIQYVLDKHIELTDNMDDCEIINRYNRLVSELKIYKEVNKLDMLKSIIYIVDQLDQNDIVYGVGRGSSISSYVLYVIGIHDIDSYEFDLDINDFFHD